MLAITTSYTSELQVIDWRNDNVVCRPLTRDKRFLSASFAPDNTLLCTSNEYVFRIDPYSQKLLDKYHFPRPKEGDYSKLEDSLITAGLSSGGTRIIASKNFGLRAYTPGSTSIDFEMQFRGPPQMVTSSDDRILYVTDHGHIGHIVESYSLASGEKLATIGCIADKINALILSPCGRLLVAGNHEGKIKLWSTLNNELLLEMERPDKKIIANLWFSADSKYLICSAHHGGDVCIWRIKRHRSHLTARLAPCTAQARKIFKKLCGLHQNDIAIANAMAALSKIYL